MNERQKTYFANCITSAGSISPKKIIKGFAGMREVTRSTEDAKNGLLIPLETDIWLVYGFT